MSNPKSTPPQSPDTTASAILKELGLMVPVPTKDAALYERVSKSFAILVKAEIESCLRHHADNLGEVVRGKKNPDSIEGAYIPAFTIKLDCDLSNGVEDFSDVFEDLEPFIKCEGVDFSVNPVREGDVVTVRFKA